MVDISRLLPSIVEDDHGWLLVHLPVQGHVLLRQLLPHRVRGKDGRELSNLEGLDGVGEGGGEGALVRVFKLLASVAPFHLNVADLNVSGGRFLKFW